MKKLSLILFVSVLTACGGGDSSSPTVEAPAQISALNAWKALMTTGGNWATAGRSSDGQSYDLNVSVAPAIAATMSDTADIPGIILEGTVFPKNPYNMVSMTTTTRRNGVLVGSETSQLYIDKTTYELSYIINPAGPYCARSSSKGLVPVTTAPNTSGFMFVGDENVFRNSVCYENAVIGGNSYNITWSYEVDSSLPLFCINVTSKSRATKKEALCFETNASGVIGPKARQTVSMDGFSLTSKNY
jgi:hypothetical protein